MKRVGLLLRSAREAQHLSLEDVERATKIRAKFLSAIEDDDFSKIPSLVYTKGFIKNYSEFLNLDSDMVLSYFRRQTMDINKSAFLPKHADAEINSSWFSLTPGKFIMIILGLCASVFFLYFFFQYRHFKSSPSLTLDRPLQGQLFEEKKIDVIGITDADATVTINGVSALVRSDGTFFDQVSLDPGVNSITVTATSRYGKSTTVTRKVGLKK